MNTSFDELKTITDEIYAGHRTEFGLSTLAILKKYNIKPRNKDGRLCQVNISIPKSKNNSILVGLRYFKKDKTFTEDHFLFEKGKPIAPYYRGKVEDILPEYIGTHKAQIKYDEL